MIRRLLIGLAVLLLLALAAALAVLSTTAGTRWLVERVVAAEPRLAVEVAGGSALRGIHFTDLRWRDESVRVLVPSGGFAWAPGCLLQGEICVQRVYTDGARVRVAGAEAEPRSGEPARIRLPFGVRVESIGLANTLVETGGTRVAIGSLSGRAGFYGSRLRLGDVRLQDLDVTLPAGGERAGDTAADGSPSVPRLPAVQPPVDVQLDGLLLEGGRLRRGGETWPLERLELAAALHGSRLSLQRLQAVAPQGRLSARGEATLEGDVPLELKAELGLVEVLDGRRLELALTLRDTLADLDVRASLSAPVEARLTGRVELFRDGIPYRAELQVPVLGYPLPAGDRVVVEDFHAKVRGDAGGYRAEASARVAGRDIPPGSWSVRGEGDWTRARIARLAGGVLGGELIARGRVSWADGVSWEADLEADGIDPGRYREELPGRLGGRARIEGSSGQAGLALRVAVAEITGELRGYPVSLSGEVERRPDGGWRLADVRLASGDNRVRVDGALDQRWDLAADLELPELAALWPGLGGRAAGRVVVDGPADSPAAELDLSGSGVRYRDVGVEALRITGRVADAFRAESRLSVVAEGIDRDGGGLGDLDLQVSGTLRDHRLSLATEGGPAPAALRVTGSLDPGSMAWSGRLAEGRVTLPDGAWELAGGPDAAWDPERRVFRLDPHCWRRHEARFCAVEPVVAGPGRLDAAAELDGYWLSWLSPWLPEGISLDGPLAARARVQWAGEGLPAASLQAESRGGQVVLITDPETEDLPLPYESVSLNARLGAEQASVRFDMESKELGRARAAVRLDPRARPRALDGELVLSGLRLDVAAPFFPQLRRIEGRVEADGRIAGTLAEPAVEGSVSLQEGAFALSGSPMALTGVGLRATVSGTRAELDGDFRIGEGEGRVAGTVAWRDGPRADVTIRGEGLEVVYPPIVEVQVNPDLRLTVEPGEVSVGGRIDVPSGLVKLQRPPGGAVPYSGDVVVVDREAPEQEERNGWQIVSDITVALGERVRFEGLGAQGRLDGSLQVRQIGDEGAEANGEIEVEDGSFEAYGTKLEIRRGRFIFAGPVTQPRLDIEAIREVDQATVGLRVSGRADRPQVDLFSEPPMPQERILAYLVTGRAPGAGPPGEEALLAQAALSLGVLGGRQVGESVAEELGVEEFRLEAAGQGEEAEVAVSGYIAPNLLVRYGVGVFQPVNTLTLRYYLTSDLYLEAVSGVDSALDIFYSFDF